MVNNFYTLHALAGEWCEHLKGCTVGDAFSQVRDELSIAFAHPERDQMLRCSTQRPLLYVFRSEGYSKARRNVATLFKHAFDRRVEDVRIATRDRMLYVDLAGGWCFLFMLFGSKANVLLVDEKGRVVEAFRNSAALEGTDAPQPRAAPMPSTFADFEERWRPTRNTTEQAVSSAMPLFGRLLARETMHRAGVHTAAPADCTEDERGALFDAAQALRQVLQHPHPHIYGSDPFPEALALVPMHHLAGQPAEAFETVDAAIRVFVRRQLAEAHYRRLYDPLESALQDAADHYHRSAEQMMEELSSPSRADRYERWGHLLMAALDDVPDDADEVTLPDLFEEGRAVTIPLDPARSPVDNAERYYRKAKRTRRSREEAEQRMVATEERAEEAADLLSRLRAANTLDAIKQFRKEHQDRLAPFVEREDKDIERFPFRRFDLGNGYEVWVGKNARQNDELTFHTAQKYDLWMHARGVPGSHTVLHLPNRDAEPDKRRKYAAASIAAYYSKARGSGLVPVMVTPRKYVRSPKGGAPGAVHVEREEVLLVEPRLPDA